MKKIKTLVAVSIGAGISLVSGLAAAKFIRRTKKQDKLEVKVPGGRLIAYSSGDPDYPGIHIEVAKDNIPYWLNLTTVEYDMEDSRYVTHVWGDAHKEDPTHDIYHEHVSDYFCEDKEEL